MRGWWLGIFWLISLPLSQAADKPNILWLTCEDMGPHLGCYGDSYATTPNVDALSARGMRYRVVWSNAPVCAPARTALISGMYPTSTGSEHMRSLVPLPAEAKMYPQLLRDLGYYCTNNSKEDYNLTKVGIVWDESSPKAHYRHRPKQSPFFAIFNFTITHESQIRVRPHTLIHDPSQVRVPSYHPDTPEVRRDWAQYYDKITQMDTLVGKALKELDEAKLTDETIVFFYSDHGSGMPRHKRFPGNSGLAVPLIVVFPEKWKHLAPKDYKPGGISDRLVSFVDFAPTLLSLAGEKPKPWMQGSAFLGTHTQPPHRYLHGFRGRMDERHDVVRSVRDERYVYLRNLLPHLPHGQHVQYQFETPTTRIWHQWYREGKLNAVQARFWQVREPEELYDLQRDPDEVHNLANDPKYREVLERFRAEWKRQAIAVRDVGLMPEAEMHRRCGEQSPYDVARRSEYPIERIVQTADLASLGDASAVTSLVQALADTDATVRYWAVMGVRIRGEAVVRAQRLALMQRLADASPSVRIAAAEALARFGDAEDRPKALAELGRLANLQQSNCYAAVEALQAIDHLGDLAQDLLPTVRELPRNDPKVHPRSQGDYILRLVQHLTGEPVKKGK